MNRYIYKCVQAILAFKCMQYAYNIHRSNKRNALCETKTMRVDTSVDTTIQFKFEQYELLYYGIELNSIHNLSTLHNKTLYSTSECTLHACN